MKLWRQTSFSVTDESSTWIKKVNIVDLRWLWRQTLHMSYEVAPALLWVLYKFISNQKTHLAFNDINMIGTA